MLDVVLAFEVRDVGRVVDGLGAVAIYGRVHKVLHVVLDGRVDERLALGLLDAGAGFVHRGQLRGSISTVKCYLSRCALRVVPGR